MTEIPATYFDGRTSQPRAVRLRWHAFDEVLEIVGEDFHERFPRRDVQIESRLGRTPRFIRLESGGRLEVADHAALDDVIGTWGRKSGSWLHRLESSWTLVLVSVAVLAAVGWATLHFALPWGARKIAFALPANLTQQLGEQTLATLDRTMLQPTKITHERQIELQAKFKNFLERAHASAAYRIEFRHAPGVGANAFALPSGTIVITDDIVFLAEDDDELLGVLAHECGHVQERHALRAVLQNSAVFVVIALITGDVSSATAFGGALPAYLLQNRFSREFEREADDHAVRTLRAAGISPLHLVDMLERLAKSHGETESAVLSYMRSHPPTPERIERIKRSATRP